MNDIPHRLGVALRGRRHALGWTQATVADRCGLSTSAYSRMELGQGGPVSLDRWMAAAAALDVTLDAHLLPPPPTGSADRLLRLVERLAERGGWSTHSAGSLDWPLVVRIARPTRREAAVVSIWDVVTDVGESIERLKRAVADETASRPAGWRVGGFVVVRACGSNRRRLNEVWYAVDDAFPDSGSRWIGALTNPRSRMPADLALAWASGDLSHLTPARLPLIRSRRVTTGL